MCHCKVEDCFSPDEVKPLVLFKGLVPSGILTGGLSVVLVSSCWHNWITPGVSRLRHTRLSLIRHKREQRMADKQASLSVESKGINSDDEEFAWTEEEEKALVRR